MITEKTQKLQSKFDELESIKNQLNSSKPNLDEILPIYEKAESHERDLLSYIESTKKAIAEKREKKA